MHYDNYYKQLFILEMHHYNQEMRQVAGVASSERIQIDFYSRLRRDIPQFRVEANEPD